MAEREAREQKEQGGRPGARYKSMFIGGTSIINKTAANQLFSASKKTKEK